MKTATVADLKNDFQRISLWIDNGEPVEIIRAGVPFAMLAPIAPPAATPPFPPHHQVDWRAQRKAIWGDRKFSDAEVKAMHEFELEGEEG